MRTCGTTATWISLPSPDDDSSVVSRQVRQRPGLEHASPGLVVRSSQNLGEELLGSLRLRVIDHLGGSSGLDDDAAIHKDDLIGDLASKPNLVGDNRHRHARCCQVLHNLQHLTDELGIER